MKGSG